MIKKWRIGRWRLTITFAPMSDVTGVNSNLEDGNHILMWDFDDTTLNDVATSLLKVQSIYELPHIHILETKENKNFIAYCFKRLPWLKVVEILAFTKGMDWNYFKYGVYRGHFTLRVTPKDGREPKLIWMLHSDTPEDCVIADLRRWTKYETLSDDARRY